jgi:hypothetical protein
MATKIWKADNDDGHSRPSFNNNNIIVTTRLHEASA